MPNPFVRRGGCEVTAATLWITMVPMYEVYHVLDHVLDHVLVHGRHACSLRRNYAQQYALEVHDCTDCHLSPRNRVTLPPWMMIRAHGCLQFHSAVPRPSTMLTPYAGRNVTTSTAHNSLKIAARTYLHPPARITLAVDTYPPTPSFLACYVFSLSATGSSSRIFSSANLTGLQCIYEKQSATGVYRLGKRHHSHVIFSVPNAERGQERGSKAWTARFGLQVVVGPRHGPRSLSVAVNRSFCQSIDLGTLGPWRLPNAQPFRSRLVPY